MEDLRTNIKERTRTHGPEHPDTLTSRSLLALELWGQGMNAEAEVECRAVLAIRERLLGAEHPDTLKIRQLLARALGEQGKHAEAEADYRALLAIRERVLGPGDRKTLGTRYNLASFLSGIDRWEEALKEAEAAYEGIRKSLPDGDHLREAARRLVEDLKAKPSDKEPDSGSGNVVASSGG